MKCDGEILFIIACSSSEKRPTKYSKGHEKGCDQPRELSGLAPEPEWLCYDLVRVFPGQTWLRLLLRELRGQIDRGEHTVCVRDAFAGEIKAGAVTGTGA